MSLFSASFFFSPHFWLASDTATFCLSQVDYIISRDDVGHFDMGLTVDA